MSLALKISKKAGARADTIASRSWPQNRISIGRGEECTLVLEDPRKQVSRVHVELEAKDQGRFHLTIVSKVNPVFINGKKHAPGSRLELAAGDRFELGEYQFELLPPAPPVQEKTVPVEPLATAPEPEADVFAEATYVGGRPPQGAAAGMREAVSVFLEGAGLAGKEIRDADSEEFLRQSGKILRAAIEGSMALLAARATAKKELRAEDRTMVASKDNNPLKLMSDPREALAFLFDTENRGDGFLDPVQAVGDAFEDLRAHEVALFAAMRAALLGTLQRFDPKRLEAELGKSAGGLGLNRKAKLWELFARYQQKLARDAEDDFNKVFGREFMGAYMAQVKRLRSGGR